MKHLTNFVKLLAEYVAFKSISTDSAYVSEIKKTVAWLTAQFQQNNFAVTILQGKSTNPVVFAEHHISNDLETVLIYGHYDVQPAIIEDGWKADPFVLREEEGLLIARGVVDNKGQNLIHIFTIFELIKKGNLKYNIKFLIEGNEETANPDMTELVKENADMLKSDFIMISDGEVIGSTPVIEASLRGGGNLTLTLRTAKDDLHSGLYGGAVPNASLEMIHVLYRIFRSEERISIPGFYEGVDAITEQQRKANLEMENKKDFQTLAGVKKITTNEGFLTQVGLMPTIEITGLSSGYTGEGYKNAIPATATVKLNFRLVASQDPAVFVEKFEKFIQKNIPEYVTYDIALTKTYPAIKVNLSNPKLTEVMELQEKVYGEKSFIKYVGGGIPVVSDFKEVLGADTLLIPLCNDDCHMHGVEENFTLDLIQKGLDFSELFFSI